LVTDDEGSPGHHEQIRRGLHPHGLAPEGSRRLRADADQRECVGLQRMEIRQGLYGAAMKVLVACEFSGIVREAFKAKGHDAWSCDLLPTEIPGQHIQGDVLQILNDGWDLMLAFPPCTHLCVSGAAWFEQKRKDGRQQEGIDFFMKFTKTNIPKTVIENPVGIMSKIYRKPDQTIQPYRFGDPFQKTTCLWLKNLPILQATHHDAPLFGESVDKGEFTSFKSGCTMPKWYSDAFSLSLEERAKVRSKTFPGIAAAMASQWNFT